MIIQFSSKSTFRRSGSIKTHWTFIIYVEFFLFSCSRTIIVSKEYLCLIYIFTSKRSFLGSKCPNEHVLFRVNVLARKCLRATVRQATVLRATVLNPS